MRSRKRPEVSADIADVGERIDRWRATRTKRSPMPEPLWGAAVRLARTHGIYPIARRLPVNYESLKRRLRGAAASASEPRVAKRAAARFVELRPTTLLPVASPPPSGPVVELVDARGAKVTIRLGSAERLDVLGLASAFWDRRA